MKRIDLLPRDVKYYKANLHCHTNISDGLLTPEEIKGVYGKRGYQVVAFTDHRTYRNHSELNDEQFLAIAALETDVDEFAGCGEDFNRIKTYHINWYDTNPDDRKEEKAVLEQPRRCYQDVESLNGYVEKMRELGFLACYNHPYWSLQNYDDYKNLKGFWAMEIYNHGCELDGLYGYHPQCYDEMLRNGQKFFCVSTDDNHNRASFSDALSDSFGGYIMIGAKELTYAAVIQALREGHFYSSMSWDGTGQGPEIRELYLQEGRLFVKTSPAARIFVKTMGRGCHRAAACPGETITEAVFKIQGDEGYLRLDVQDVFGRHANTNAYFLEDLFRRMNTADVEER